MDVFFYIPLAVDAVEEAIAEVLWRFAAVGYHVLNAKLEILVFHFGEREGVLFCGEDLPVSAGEEGIGARVACGAECFRTGGAGGGDGGVSP